MRVQGIRQGKPAHPRPAEALKQPGEIRSLEELYLAGQHLEQYRHATFLPADYYLEGLRRDPTDIRLNNAYGLYLLRNAQIKKSVPCFEAAIKKQTWRNPNPYAGEAYFNLGLALELLGNWTKPAMLSSRPPGAPKRLERPTIIWPASA